MMDTIDSDNLVQTNGRNRRADFLVGVSVVVILVILWVVITMPDVSEYAKGALTTILGVFLNQLTNVFNFEFGTTRKGEEKQTQITNEYIKSPSQPTSPTNPNPTN